MEEERVRESQVSFELERQQLENQVGKASLRRTQLLALLLPFLGSLGWTGYGFYTSLFELLRSNEATPKAIFELCFWGSISGLVLYVVIIIVRERSMTIERASEAQKRLLKVTRRLQQMAIEEAGPRHSPSPSGAPSTPHTPATPQQPVRPSAPARPKEERSRRGPVVLDLDAAETKDCPMCAETVRAKAKICRYCRHEFPLD